jgi:hypothetical protein
MAPGPDREQVRQALWAGGFLRLETADTLEQALADFRADHHATCPLLVWENRLEGGSPLASIRALQKEFGDTRELPVALITREAPLPQPEDPLIQSVPWPSAGDLSWLALLDDLAGLD